VYATGKIPRPAERFEVDLQRFVEHYTALWQGAATITPFSTITYTAAAQRKNEEATDALIGSMERELPKYPRSEKAQTNWRARLFQSFRHIGTESFRFPDRHFDIIFSPDYFDATRAFARQARAFDAHIETGALAQAMRNVWVMNCLQLFVGRKPALSPSIFAYSMLYPYTDNPLDQPLLSRAAKETTCRRLAMRLSGQPLIPRDAHEASVWRLVAMIEEEYPRDIFPAIYSSLLAIHAAQVKSLDQQRRSSITDVPALLAISIEKGGSSVLADGWLAAGNLCRAEAEFVFGFGVMLQLLDDLQDLHDDRKAGHWTLFTSTASHETLAGLTSRLWHFLHVVLESNGCFADPQGLELRDLIRRNSITLMLRAMAENAELYSVDYLQRMEQYSPLSFAFLNECRREIEAKFTRIWPVLARKRKLVSIFDLLG
jgi:hypothetical protein